MNATLLIIDDEEGIRLSLRGILEDEGYTILESSSGEAALELLASSSIIPDMIFLDIWLPGIDGLEVLKKIKLDKPDIPVVMISGHGTIETAITALRLGAHDFIEKPLSLDKTLLIVRNTLEIGQLRFQNKALRASMMPNDQTDSFVANSPAMLEFCNNLEKVAPTDAWVLITGENGSGKELAAKSIHAKSARNGSPFVAVNCAAIPEELIESELFGHEKGSFTGADSVRIGKFELADKGTLFLDEIADMSLKTQAKILRILQEQVFERVGANKTISVNVRVLAATNKNLEQAIKNQTFRQDLYYRLRVFPLHVPPLRERGEDIESLIALFAKDISRRYSLPAPIFTQEALDVLKKWRWPGNVRELTHLVERLTILYSAQNITEFMLPQEMSSTSESMEIDTSLACIMNLNYKNAKIAFETYYIEKKLEEVGGNITHLAELIGLERTNIHRKLKSREN